MNKIKPITKKMLENVKKKKEKKEEEEEEDRALR
jgi:hypothetical protein